MKDDSSGCYDSKLKNIRWSRCIKTAENNRVQLPLASFAGSLTINKVSQTRNCRQNNFFLSENFALIGRSPTHNDDFMTSFWSAVKDKCWSHTELNDFLWNFLSFHFIKFCRALKKTFFVVFQNLFAADSIYVAFFIQRTFPMIVLCLKI